MLKSLSLCVAAFIGLGVPAALADDNSNNVIAAQLLQPQGKVLVNKGEGFVQAGEDIDLVAGHQIFVGDESSAAVAYAAGGCILNISEKSIVTIQAKAPCKAGESLAMANDVMIRPAFGSGGEIVSQALVLAPVVAVVGLVAVLAATYDEPKKAVTP